MDGIYKVTSGSWIAPPSTEVECVPDDTILDLQIDGMGVTRGDALNIPVIRRGDRVPQPGTTVYLVGVHGLPDGFYIVAEDPGDDYDPGINIRPHVVRTMGPAPSLITDSQSTEEEDNN